MFYTSSSQLSILSPKRQQIDKFKQDQANLSINPFQVIQKSLEAQDQRKQNINIDINALTLDLSSIQYKSPSYSQFYNSVGSEKDKFFPKKRVHEIKIEEDSMENEQTCKFMDNKIKDNQQTKRNKYKLLKSHQIKYPQVPTFSIKLPQQINQQRKKYKLKLTEQLSQQLQQIYKGKFKILRNQ